MKRRKSLYVFVLLFVMLFSMACLFGMSACGDSEKDSPDDLTTDVGGDDESGDENPGDSAEENEDLSGFDGTLAVPEISLTNNVLSWDAVQYAKSYEVTLCVVYDDESAVVSTETISATSYELPFDAGGKYEVTVKALRVDDDWDVASEPSETVSVAVIGVSSVEEFKSISNDMTAYYVLTNNIDFEGAYQSVIGAAPLYSYINSDGDAVYGAAIGTHSDEWNVPVGPDEVVGQQGEEFTGTFDGRGYSLINYKVVTGNGEDLPWWKPESYGAAIFGWLGQTGKICNLSLSGADVMGGKHSSFIACVNGGVIENICIEKDCQLYSQYNLSAAISAFNYGTVRNVVCYLETYGQGYGADQSLPIACNENGTTTNLVDCYIGNTSDLTSELGGLWIYVEEEGTFLPGHSEISRDENENPDGGSGEIDPDYNPEDDPDYNPDEDPDDGSGASSD